MRKKNEKKSGNWGGARTGTGSVSPRGGPTASVCTRILQTTKEELRAQALLANVSLSAYIGDILEELLKIQAAKKKQLDT